MDINKNSWKRCTFRLNRLGENMAEFMANMHAPEEWIAPDSVTDIANGYQDVTFLSDPVVGNNIVNMSYAFTNAQFSNPSGAIAVFGENCENIVGAYAGSNVVGVDNSTGILGKFNSLDYMFMNCKNMTSPIVTPDNVTSMVHTYDGCTGLVDLSQSVYTSFGKLTDIRYMFANCTNIKINNKAYSNILKNAINVEHAFENALAQSGPEVVNLVLNENVKSITYMFNNSRAKVNFDNLVIGDNITNMSHAFSWDNMAFGNAVCGSNVTNMCSAYMNGHVYSICCGPKVIDMSYAFRDVIPTRPMPAACGPLVTNMAYTYGSNSRSISNINEFVCGSRVINMSHTYERCYIPTTPICGDNVTDFSYTYSNCWNLTTCVCGPNVTNMSGAYSGCRKIDTAVCGPNVIDMSYAYCNCNNIINAVAADNVRNMRCAYYCSDGRGKLTNIMISNNVEDLTCTFDNCFNVNALANGSTMLNIPESCRELANAFKRCGKLNISVTIESTNINNMDCAFDRCSNIQNIFYCEDFSAVSMSSSFMNCDKCVTLPKLSNNTIYADNTYRECKNCVMEFHCPDSVVNAHHLFMNCKSMTGDVVVGANVVNGQGMYEQCNGATGTPYIGHEGGPLSDIAFMYTGCSQLTGPVSIRNDINNYCYTFARCKNITGEIYLHQNMDNLTYTFAGCEKLTGEIFEIPQSIQSLYYTFYHTKITGSPVIHSNITNLQYAFTSTRINGFELHDNILDMSSAFRECPNIGPDHEAFIPANVVNLSAAYHGTNVSLPSICRIPNTCEFVGWAFFGSALGVTKNLVDINTIIIEDCDHFPTTGSTSRFSQIWTGRNCNTIVFNNCGDTCLTRASVAICASNNGYDVAKNIFIPGYPSKLYSEEYSTMADFLTNTALFNMMVVSNPPKDTTIYSNLYCCVNNIVGYNAETANTFTYKNVTYNLREINDVEVPV